MSARLSALSDKDIDTCIDLPNGMFFGADKRCDWNAVKPCPFDHRRWSYPERVGDETYWMAKRHIHQRFSNLRHRGRKIAGDHLITGHGNSGFPQEVDGKVEMSFWNVRE